MRVLEATKAAANALCSAVMLPIAFTCWLEKRTNPRGEAVFSFWAQLTALLPGLPGVYLRRAFYRFTLNHCDLHFHIGFGAFFSHRQVVLEQGVYIGPYAIIGSAHLGEGCLIGSRVSVVSGGDLHELDESGCWTPADLCRLRQIKIGAHTWIGEGAIIMAPVGAGSMIAAGAVVGAPIAEGIMVAGNPARFVRRLRQEPRNGPAAFVS